MGAERIQLLTHASPSYKYIPETLALVASLDVKTAFDVANPSVVSRILTLRGVRGHLTASLPAELQDVRGCACFENSETEFRYSGCVRQGGVEAGVVETCGQIRAVES